jgi:hypothetical protein
MGQVVLKNLQTSFKFRVILIGLAETTTVKVQKVTTPEVFTTSERVHFERGVKKRLAGTIAIDDKLTLEAIIPNRVGDAEFYNLSQRLFNSVTQQMTTPQIYFESITIMELDEMEVPKRTHMFTNCVLEKYELPDFDASSSDNAIEKLTFMVNGYVRIGR